MLMYGRRKSAKLGLVGGAAYLGAAVFIVVIFLWGRTLWWVGLVIIGLVVPVYIGADRFNQSSAPK